MSEEDDIRMWQQAEQDACTCATTYASYEGPEVDCPVHGAVKALNEVMRERDLLLWLHAEAVWRRDITLNQLLSEIAEVTAVAESERSSRQAWAEEALRLDEAITQTIARFEVQAAKAEDKIGEHPDALMANACWKRAATWLSEATSHKQIAADTVSDSNAASSRPQCTVHPEVKVSVHEDTSVPDLYGDEEPEVWVESPTVPGGEQT